MVSLTLSYKVYSPIRNVVVGCVNADTIRPEVQEALDDDAVHFMPYYKLPTWTGSENLVKEMMQIGIDLAQKVDYPLDGMVAEVVEDAVKEHMGSTEHNRGKSPSKKKVNVRKPLSATSGGKRVVRVSPQY